MAFNKKIQSKLKKRIQDNVERGSLVKEGDRKTYDLLAYALLNSINTWLPMQILNEKVPKEKNFRSYMWNLIFPYFTQKGLKEFDVVKL
jgi:hypothetical protein